jgi:DNA recombination protein Rad52
MPTKDKTAPPAEAAAADPAPTPEEAEAAVAAGDEAAPEAEVRAEEMNAGIGKPVGDSAWPEEIVEELRKPLDPNRVRRREGRGSTKYEYLAGHDVKRRANEIFGFGNWGHTIEEQVEIGAVEVKKREGEGTGFHVAYRCIVRVWVRHEGGLFETQGSGYGDGVEYTPAARLTACELALKESETDALKRAFTDLGDQFGLILYAKDDEKKRVARESSRGATSGRVVRQENAAVNTAPKGWPEALDRFDARLGLGKGEGAAWLEELVEKRFGQPSLTSISSGQRHEAFAGFASVVMYLEEEVEGDLAFTTDLRAVLQAAFAAKNEGLSLDGPPWRYGPNEQDRPVKGEHAVAGDEAEPSAADAEQASDASGS